MKSFLFNKIFSSTFAGFLGYSGGRLILEGYSTFWFGVLITTLIYTYFYFTNNGK